MAPFSHQNYFWGEGSLKIKGFFGIKSGFVSLFQLLVRDCITHDVSLPCNFCDCRHHSPPSGVSRNILGLNILSRTGNISDWSLTSNAAFPLNCI